ncbi:MAG: ABC transporter substrate-binding protein [Candidatus Adiutrix sp.]|jgi:NitT/TauT family transport system substrate-binding protein|nr:ABC transporter substrate-binding protein [Candidatus Adiutrix sp.]
MQLFSRKALLALLGLAFAAASSAAQAELHIGRGQGASTMPMLAQDSGYFAEEGVEVKFTPFLSSADGLNALNAGKIDVGVDFGTGAPLTFATQGAKFVIIGGTLSGGHPIISKAENAHIYKDIEGFRGKTVGTTRLYTSDVVWRGALHKAGIELGRDVKAIEFKRPVDVVEAVKSGKIDVGVASSGQVHYLNESDLEAPLWSNDLFPDHPCCRIVATQDVIKNHRPELVKFLKALLRAEKKFTQDRNFGVTAVINQLKLDEKVARTLVLEPHSELAVDPNTKAVVQMWEHMNNIGYLKSDLDPRSLIDTSIYLQALEELKTEHPDPFWATLEARFRAQNE